MNRAAIKPELKTRFFISWIFHLSHGLTPFIYLSINHHNRHTNSNIMLILVQYVACINILITIVLNLHTGLVDATRCTRC